LSKAFLAYGQLWNEFMWPLVHVYARQRIGVARRGGMAKPAIALAACLASGSGRL
jgi:hypothetical protein